LIYFLDAYLGYHQIKMKESDQLATLFVTPDGTYCYVTIPFGLKNAGATYQCTMQKCLEDQIRRNIHAYVVDIAVMSKKQDDLIADLKETFNNLRKYNMMLNPTKCVFRVPAGQLLGFIVSHHGIEVNPEKIKAILEISWPNDLKDVQRLTGCMAAVSRFISRLGKKALPLYKLMKKLDEFVWTDEADAALKDLKRAIHCTSPSSSRRPGAHVIIHGGNQQGRQHRHHGRMQGRSAGVRRTETSLLCQRGPDGIQAALPSLPEVGIRSFPSFAQVTTLLL
jgi:hypothetical protein